MAAYNGYVGTGDWNVVALHKAEPGDTYLVHAGLYKGNRRNYVDEYGLTFDGTYLLTAKGTPEKPITIKAAGDGEVIFDGDGAFRLFDVMAADYHIFEGLTIRNAEVAFWAGVKDVAGAKGLTVRNNRIEGVGVGVTTQFAGSKDFYIADNVFIGRDDPRRVLGWAGPANYGAHPINSYYADQGLRLRPRHRAQRRRVLPRRHFRVHARRARRRTRTTGPSRSTSTTTTST